MSFEDYSTQGVQPEVHVVAGRVIHGIPVSQITEGPPFIGMYSQIIDDIFVDMGSIRISQTMPHPLILLGSSLPTLLTGTTAPNTQHIFPLNIITIDPDPIVRLTIQPPEAQTAQHANYLAEYFRIAKQFVLNRLTSLIAQVDGGSTVRLGPIMTQAHGAPIVMPSGTIAWGRDQRGYIVKSAGIAKESTEPSSEEIWTGFLDKKAMALTLLFADIITLMLLRHRYEILLRQSAPPHIYPHELLSKDTLLFEIGIELGDHKILLCSQELSELFGWILKAQPGLPIIESLFNILKTSSFATLTDTLDNGIQEALTHLTGPRLQREISTLVSHINRLRDAGLFGRSRGYWGTYAQVFINFDEMMETEDPIAQAKVLAGFLVFLNSPNPFLSEVETVGQRCLGSQIDALNMTLKRDAESIPQIEQLRTLQSIINFIKRDGRKKLEVTAGICQRGPQIQTAPYYIQTLASIPLIGL